MKISSCLLLLLVLGCGDAANDPPEVVTTNAGKVRGSIENDLLVFRGIPYAEPPVGDLRFRPPRPKQPWPGRRDALEFGSPCVQPDWDNNFRPMGQEDCLYLNVLSPNPKPKTPLPVLIYIHGGAYITGHGGSQAMPDWSPSHLARSGAVVVSFNYRLGPFGFAAHPALSQETSYHGSGNYGFMDQIEALRWAQANIRAFGGDPGRVLVFGVSAGGGSSAVMVASPLARGLFQRAILESPGGSSIPLANAEAQGQRLATRLGCEGSGAAACLRSKPAYEVMSALATSLRIGESQAFYGPVVDGNVLPESLFALFERGGNSVPTIIGTTSEEFSWLIYDLYPTPVATEADYQRRVRETFGQTAGDLILQAYPASRYRSPQDALVALYTDNIYTCPARRLARGLGMSQPGRVWRYVYTHAFRRGSAAMWGAGHGYDDIMVWHTFRPGVFDPDADERALADTMTSTWIGFAASGDPTLAGASPWPSYQPAQDNYLAFDTPITRGTGFHGAECDFWEPYLY